MVKWTILAGVLAFALWPHAARATTCVQSHVFVTGEVLTASTLNANPAAEIACINGNIDNTNIGPAGIYASQIKPTNTTQARFGGSVGYAFPSYVDVGAGNAANLSPGDGGFSRSATSGAIRMGGASASGTLDYGASNANKFTLTGGALITSTAQSCGTISGYHIECGSVNNGSFSCSASTSCAVANANFATAYASTPVCAVTSTAPGSASSSTPSVAITTSQVQISAWALATLTTANVNYSWICVGV